MTTDEMNKLHRDLATSQWGVANPHGYNEEYIMAHAHYNYYLSTTENTESKTLLYGPHGEAILVRKPRAVGFKVR